MLKQKDSQKKRILFLIADKEACGWYRCGIPGKQLSEQGHYVKLGDLKPTGERIYSYDIVVFQRETRPKALEVIKKLNDMGKTTVFELDDDLWHLDKTNPAYKYWKGDEIKRKLEACIKECQIVTTSTDNLADQMRQLNRNIHVLPNMLPDKHWQAESKEKKSDGNLIIGWAGSRNRMKDLHVLSGTIEQLLDMYSNVEFHLAGDTSYPFKKHDRIKCLQGVGLEQYQVLINTFDIGIAPLVDSHFNRCKSDLKFVEYGMVGMPVVASRVDAYTASVKHGENGFLARNSKDWLKYLKRLVEDEDLRDRIGSEAKKLAETRTISKNIHLWEEAYGIE